VLPMGGSGPLHPAQRKSGNVLHDSLRQFARIMEPVHAVEYGSGIRSGVLEIAWRASRGIVRDALGAVRSVESLQSALDCQTCSSHGVECFGNRLAASRPLSQWGPAELPISPIAECLTTRLSFCERTLKRGARNAQRRIEGQSLLNDSTPCTSAVGHH